MYLISGNITSNVTGNLLVITGNGNIGNITSNFRTLVPPNQHLLFIAVFYSPLCPVHANTFVLFMLSFHVTPPPLLYRQHLS